MENKKIYFIFLLVLMFLLLICTSCFASTTYTDVNGIVHTLPDLPDDVGSNPYLVSRCEKYNNYALLYTKDTNFSKFVYDTSNNSFAPCDSSGKQCEYIYLAETDSLDNPTKWNIRGSWGLLQPASSHYIIYSNHDIYNTDGTIFFHPAPQGIVAQQVEEVEMSQALQEILGILPLILVVVVSLVGLRKALQMLFNSLKAC